MASRVLSPNGFTVADLVETYTQLAPVLLPHLESRPLTLKRFPTTITGEAFWEKDAPNFTPKWVTGYAVPRKAGGEPIHWTSSARRWYRSTQVTYGLEMLGCPGSLGKLQDALSLISSAAQSRTHVTAITE